MSQKFYHKIDLIQDFLLNRFSKILSRLSIVHILSTLSNEYQGGDCLQLDFSFGYLLALGGKHTCIQPIHYQGKVFQKVIAGEECPSPAKGQQSILKTPYAKEEFVPGKFPTQPRREIVFRIFYKNSHPCLLLILQPLGYAFFQCYIYIGTALFHMAQKLLDLWSCKNQIHSNRFLEVSRQNGQLLMSKKLQLNHTSEGYSRKV